MVHMLAGHCTCSLLQGTALREIWAKLYQLASEAGKDADIELPICHLNCHIISLMEPDGAMVLSLSNGLFIGPDEDLMRIDR